jgi:Protein kinase domain
VNSHTWRDDAEQPAGPAQGHGGTRRDDAEPAAGVNASQSVLRLPSALAREWQFVSELASWGAEADLLVVTNESGERRVAKIYRARIEPKTEVLRRVGGTSFEHVVQLYDHGFSDGRWYELLEYIASGSLEDLIRNEGPKLGPDVIHEVLWELATAIDHLHRNGVVHRDIKPSNVLVRTRAPLDLVLTDFGIASVLDQASRRFTAGHRTIAYAAPETSAGEVSPAADWWSLGIIIVEMSMGRHPFATAAGTLLDDRVIMGRLAQMPVDELANGVEGPWRDLCRGLLRRDAKNRWGFDEIARWIRGDPTLSVAAEQGPRRYGLVPFYFAGNRYDSLPLIAAAFAANWQEARKSVERNHFFDWVKDELGDNEWRQFLTDLDRDCENLDERILRICAKLDPAATPVFCGSALDTAGLERIARDALAGHADTKMILHDLRRRGILMVAAKVTGINHYRELHSAWQNELMRFEERRDALAQAGGPPATDRAYAQVEAELLLAVLPRRGTPYVETLRAQVEEFLNRDVLACSWFRVLGNPSTASPAVACLMKAAAPFAESHGRAERQRREAQWRVTILRGAAVFAVGGGLFYLGALAVHSASGSGGTYAGGTYRNYTFPSTVNQSQAAPAAADPATAPISSTASLAFVNEYYRLWNLGDYRAMYVMLGSHMQQTHPYDRYVRAHAFVTKIDVDATPTSDPTIVNVHIVSHDREKDGTITENVTEGRWYLATEGGQLKLAAQSVHEVQSGSAAAASTSTDTATAATAAAPSAESTLALVREYYDLWNRGDFQAQYALLSARMRRKHPYADFTKYHANVVRLDATVTATSSPYTVAIRIVSQDREKDGSYTQNVTEGEWNLAWEDGRLKLDAQDVHEVK